jgi:hypothetical protein
MVAELNNRVADAYRSNAQEHQIVSVDRPPLGAPPKPSNNTGPGGGSGAGPDRFVGDAYQSLASGVALTLPHQVIR